MQPKILKYLEKHAVLSSGTGGRFKLAAGVVRRGKLLAVGVNSYKTHPIMMNSGYREGQDCLHAEADAIKKCIKMGYADLLSSCELYVVRVKHPSKFTDDYVHGLAKPCEGCNNIINDYNFKSVYYTTDEHGRFEVL